MSVIFNFNFKSPAQIKQNIDRGSFLKGTNNSAVILAHGMTGSPQEMNFFAEFLKKGYSVLCPRLANHGQPITMLKKTT